MNIQFSQVREDPNIELYTLNKITKIFPKILLVGSGGCTLFTLLNKNIDTIDVIDQNKEQLFLIQLKLEIICYCKDKFKINDFFEGKLFKEEYDHILLNIKATLSKECYSFWMENKLFVYRGINQNGVFELLFKELFDNSFNYEKVFNRNYLIQKFGDNAVINSMNKEFSIHFETVINRLRTKYTQFDNYFYHQIIHNSYNKQYLPKYFDNIDNIIENKQKIKYINLNYADYVQNTNKKYDIVQISNITDWMNKIEIDLFFKNIYTILNKNGYLISRRLNGDYNLAQMLSEYLGKYCLL